MTPFHYILSVWGGGNGIRFILCMFALFCLFNESVGIGKGIEEDVPVGTAKPAKEEAGREGRAGSQMYFMSSPANSVHLTGVLCI